MENKAKTLLEMARETPARRHLPVDEQRVELAVAWMCGEITLMQARDALGKDKKASEAIYCILARGLRAAYIAGLLQKADGSK